MAYALNDKKDPVKPPIKIEAKFFDMKSHPPLIVVLCTVITHPSYKRFNAGAPGAALRCRAVFTRQNFGNGIGLWSNIGSGVRKA